MESIYLAKTKARGRFLQNLEMLVKIPFLYFRPEQMSLKRFYQKFIKLNASGVNVVQNINHVKNTHIHLELLCT